MQVYQKDKNGNWVLVEYEILKYGLDGKWNKIYFQTPKKKVNGNWV